MGDDDNKEDFTLLQNLGEFTHGEDDDVDRRLGIAKKKQKTKTPDAPAAKKKAPPKTPEPPEEEDLVEADEELSSAPAFESIDSDSDSISISISEESDSMPSFDSSESSGGSDFGEATDFGGSDLGESAFPSEESDGDFKLSDDAVESLENENTPFSIEDVDDDSKPLTGPDPDLEDEEDNSFSSSPSLLSSTSTSSSSSPSAPSTSSFTSLPQMQTPSSLKPETLDDVKEFAKSMSYGKVGSGGNPPFGLILKNIKYKEDVSDIIIILREHGLLNEKNEEVIKHSLGNGSLLINQISEFSAIYLTHKFRRFDLEILMGLADEIHPSKSYQNSRGLVEKMNLRQNKVEHVNLEENSLDLESILLTTTPQVEGKKILKYLGIVSVHRILEEEELHNQGDEKSKRKTGKRNSEHQDHDHRKKMGEIDMVRYSPSMSTLYQNLANDLLPKALALKGNAVIGINFVVTPLVPSNENSFKPLYQLTCTGNVVWVS